MGAIMLALPQPLGFITMAVDKAVDATAGRGFVLTQFLIGALLGIDILLTGWLSSKVVSFSEDHGQRIAKLEVRTAEMPPKYVDTKLDSINDKLTDVKHGLDNHLREFRAHYATKGDTAH